MTPVDCLFLTPEGVPIVGALVEFQLRKSAFNDVETGVLMPRLVTAVTDVEGRCTVSLWNTTELWYVTVEDPLSNTGLSYKFYVPALDAGNASVRLQDIVVEGEIPDTPYDEAAIQAIMNAKANALAAQTGAQAAQVGAEAAAAGVEQALSGVGAIVVQITQIRDDIVQINTGLVQLGETITELGEQIIAASEATFEAAEQVASQVEHIDGVKTTIDQMAGVIETQAGQVATAKSSVDQTKIDVTTLTNQVNTDKGVVTGLASTVGTQAGQVAQTKTYIDDINTNVNTKSAAADASAIAAASSANTSTTQAGIATTAAGVSTTKADEALASANAADVSHTQAQAAVVQTGLDAQAADVSASTASTQAGIATTKAGEAETARGAAVVARNQAVQAATDAGTSAGLAEAKLAEIIQQTTTFGNGWSAVLAIATDGERRVFQIVDWSGGAGTKPALGFIGETGIVATAALAMNIRGAQGASGSGSGTVSSVNGVGDVDGNVTLEIGDIPGLADALASAGAVKTVAGIAPDGTGNIPTASLVNALEASFDQAGTAQTQVTALAESLEDVAYSGEFADLNNIPVAFTPTVHGHTIDQITGLQAALDATGGVKKVNGISPDGSGLVTLTAANVGAEPSGTAATAIAALAPVATSGNFADMAGEVATNKVTITGGALVLDGPLNTYKSIQIKTDGKIRFDIGVDNTAESGENAGSDMYFNAFDDAGNYLGSMFSISRRYGVYMPMLNVPTRSVNDSTTAAANTEYVDRAVSTVSGDLDDLTTEEKGSLVLAINEVNGKVPSQTTDLQVSSLKVVNSTGGDTFVDFGLLTPSAGQSTLLRFHSGEQPVGYDFGMMAVGGAGVNASGDMHFYGNQLDLTGVNTVLLKMPGQSSPSNVVNAEYTGALSDLTTTAKGNVVAAINEVNAKPSGEVVTALPDNFLFNSVVAPGKYYGQTNDAAGPIPNQIARYLIEVRTVRVAGDTEIRLQVVYSSISAATTAAATRNFTHTVSTGTSSFAQPWLLAASTVLTGLLTSLQTTDKATLVAAINEVNAKIDDAPSGADSMRRQTFVAGTGFVAGTTTSLTLTQAPLAPTKEAISVAFDAAYQQGTEWSYDAPTGVVTFITAIPAGVGQVEVSWSAPLSVGVADSITGETAVGVAIRTAANTVAARAAIGAIATADVGEVSGLSTAAKVVVDAINELNAKTGGAKDKTVAAGYTVTYADDGYELTVAPSVAGSIALPTSSSVGPNMRITVMNKGTAAMKFTDSGAHLPGGPAAFVYPGERAQFDLDGGAGIWYMPGRATLVKMSETYGSHVANSAITNGFDDPELTRMELMLDAVTFSGSSSAAHVNMAVLNASLSPLPGTPYNVTVKGSGPEGYIEDVGVAIARLTTDPLPYASTGNGQAFIKLTVPMGDSTSFYVDSWPAISIEGKLQWTGQPTFWPFTWEGVMTLGASAGSMRGLRFSMSAGNIKISRLVQYGYRS